MYPSVLNGTKIRWSYTAERACFKLASNNHSSCGPRILLLYLFRIFVRNVTRIILLWEIVRILQQWCVGRFSSSQKRPGNEGSINCSRMRGPLPDFLVVRITSYTIRSYSTVYYRIWYSRTCKCRGNIPAGCVIRPWEIQKELDWATRTQSMAWEPKLARHSIDTQQWDDIAAILFVVL